MHITHLSLTNFRNYGRLELPIPLGATLLHGNNAQGKTNLLEAIYYLSTTRSPHADYDAQLINWAAAAQDDPVVVGRLVAQISTKRQEHLIEMRLIEERSRKLRNGQSGFRREVLLDRRKVRLMDLLGTLRVVLFLPEDIQLITGSPSKRRRYLDINLCQIDSVYCRTLSQYNKVMEQRNALLRQIAEGSGSRSLLPVYDEKLARLGGVIFARRAEFLARLSRELQRIHYEQLTRGNESMRLHYLPRLDPEIGGGRTPTPAPVMREWVEAHSAEAEIVAERFAAMLEETRGADIARGSTSVGPHRDDWFLQVNGRALSSFGSRGQQRSAILALKIAEIEWMTQQTGETPVLLLDEIVAELDEHRRAALLETVQQASQAILTATDPGMFTADFLKIATTLTVHQGRITRDTTTSAPGSS